MNEDKPVLSAMKL